MSLDDSQNQSSRFGNVSLLGESILENHDPTEYNWAFEDVADLDSATNAQIIDVDSVDERCFILFSNLKLVEINLQTKQVVQELSIAELDGASEHMQDQKAQAFAMFKELNMIAVSTESGFHMFDYET